MKVKAGQMKQQLGRQMKSETKFKLAKNSFCCFHIATTTRNEKGSETKTFRRLSSSYLPPRVCSCYLFPLPEDFPLYICRSAVLQHRNFEKARFGRGGISPLLSRHNSALSPPPTSLAGRMVGGGRRHQTNTAVCLVGWFREEGRGMMQQKMAPGQKGEERGKRLPSSPHLFYPTNFPTRRCEIRQ